MLTGRVRIIGTSVLTGLGWLYFAGFCWMRCVDGLGRFGLETLDHRTTKVLESWLRKNIDWGGLSV